METLQGYMLSLGWGSADLFMECYLIDDAIISTYFSLVSVLADAGSILSIWDAFAAFSCTLSCLEPLLPKLFCALFVNFEDVLSLFQSWEACAGWPSPSAALLTVGSSHFESASCGRRNSNLIISQESATDPQPLHFNNNAVTSDCFGLFFDRNCIRRQDLVWTFLAYLLLMMM